MMLDSSQLLSEAKKVEFYKLYQEFIQTYLPSKQGQQHIAYYIKGRDQAQQNLNEITQAVKQGQDVTNAVLLKLLPYLNTRGNRERGAWIHIAPSITKDLKDWYQNAGWTKPEDWPKIAQAILNFIQHCLADPSQLREACDDFSILPYSKGFQTGMLTPILNALRPDDFVLINNKSRQVLNYFAGTGFDQPLKYYPEITTTAQSMITEVRDDLRKPGLPELHDTDLFDMFSHWLVGVKKYFRKSILELAPPFSEMFANNQEAEWAFDLLKETADRLGVRGPDDEMAAFTLRKRSGENLLRMSYGNWLVLGFTGSNKSLKSIDVALFTQDADFKSYWSGKFKQPKNEQTVTLYSVPIESINSFEETVLPIFYETLDFISSKFSGWKRSNFRHRSNQHMTDAVFDMEKRAQLLSQGVITDERIDEDEEEKTEIEGVENDTGEKYKTEQIPFLPDVEIKINPDYSQSDFARDTGFPISIISSWVKAIERKGQAIFYGPPGTGKTYIAEKLARHLIGGGDGFSEIVQFHPAYAYEDFIQGIRPQTRPDGGLDYPLVPGRFLRFCARASERSERCVLIIDEINRANLSRVFGELMYLLEYRNASITLAGGESFTIPSNVRLIGTMNTADRSIALVDHALRRRFAFLELYPEMDVLRQYHQTTGFNVDGLIDVIERLNQRIDNPHYAMGISYFLLDDLATQIEDIWKMEIEPYLNEYFFDHPDWARELAWSKVKAKILP